MKKLLALLSILVLVGGVAAYFHFHGTPLAKSTKLFQDASAAKISRIFVDGPTSSIELSQQNGLWRIKRPIDDLADPVEINALLGTIQKFSVSSIITEQKKNYAQYDLEGDRAIRLQVFVEGTDKAVLDGFVGKAASGFGESFFRYEGKDPVYLAKDILAMRINQEPKNYRSKMVFHGPLKECFKISFDGAEFKFKTTITRSSDTWSAEPPVPTLSSGNVVLLLNRLDFVRISEFGSGEELDSVTGFKKPVLTITADGVGEPQVVRFGNKTKAAAKNDPVSRYVQVDGRNAVLLIPEPTYQDIYKEIKSLFTKK